MNNKDADFTGFRSLFKPAKSASIVFNAFLPLHIVMEGSIGYFYAPYFLAFLASFLAIFAHSFAPSAFSFSVNS